MAIKIIKEGKVTKFTKTCPECDCEFEYDVSDLQTDYGVCLTTYHDTYVICPCCGKHLHHGHTESTFPNYPNINDTMTRIDVKDLDCDNCPNRPDPEKPVVGDSACDWCIKRHFTCK